MRRAYTEMQKQIEDLIREEADPRERARLLILYQISSVLIDNVAAVREVTDEFRNHRTEYDKHIDKENSYLNQGRGMWRIGALGLIFAQGVLGYLYVQHVDAFRKVEAIVTAQGKDVESLKTWKQFEDRNGGSTK